MQARTRRLNASRGPRRTAATQPDSLSAGVQEAATEQAVQPYERMYIIYKHKQKAKQRRGEEGGEGRKQRREDGPATGLQQLARERELSRAAPSKQSNT